jgi:hypothetical protein
MSRLKEFNMRGDVNHKDWKPVSRYFDNQDKQYGGQYYPAGEPAMKIPDHAYGKGIATSFGTVHSDWKLAGPNLAPYPNSSGQMTGGSSRRKKTSKRANSRLAKKTKKVGKRKA